MNRQKQNNTERNQLAINSAALQDHLLRKCNFDLVFKSKSKVEQPPAQPRSTSEMPVQQNTQNRQWLMLPSIKKNSTKTTSILPYESEEIKKLKAVATEEEKMQKYKQKLTLAQRLGIISAPPPPLSAKQWEEIESMSKKRKDSENVCSICLQDFRLTPQTILSCSHVFHLNCLNSFQKHNKATACPICRRKDYEKKVIDEGIRIYTMKCIIKIQASFRGSRTRKRLYEQLIESGYKAQSKLFGRRLIGYKMWRLSSKMHQKAMQQLRKYNNMIKKIETQFKMNNEQLFQDLVQYQRSKINNTEELNAYLAKNAPKTKQHEKEQIKKWNQAKNQALKRADHTCSICLNSLFSKKVYLLSCSHMFHVNCIDSFERYSMPNNLCPCCRSHYDKKLFEIPKE